MSADRFSLPDQPAENATALLEHLNRCHASDYLYRGQTQDYGSPLLPSVFRGVLDYDDRGEIDKLPEHGARSLRSLGREFVGDYAHNRSQRLRALSSNEQETEGHRDEIRQKFLNSFGYLLGSTFAQHYGFKSEMLDVSTNPEIAIFFATHHHPAYESVPAQHR